jgi:hypothetical protein
MKECEAMKGPHRSSTNYLPVFSPDLAAVHAAAFVKQVGGCMVI